MPINIAIDGPAGAGKSSISKRVAKEMEMIYVDTGALYRTIALYILRKNISPNSPSDVISQLTDISIELKFINGEQRVILNGEDVSDKIRTEEISTATSTISTIREVRDFLFSLQQRIANSNNIIMDGRDIGTVVLPNAQLKIYLTASDTARANRRYKEICEKGNPNSVGFDEILVNIQERDKQDMERKISPLKKADDAIIVDTSNLSFEQSVMEIVKLIQGIRRS